MSAIEHELYEFRNMQVSDLEQVMRIEKQAHAFPWTQGIFEDCIRVGYYCPVLVANQDVVAYAVMSAIAGEAHIFNVCVDPDCQGKGFGRQLVEHLLAVADSKNMKTAFLEVRPSNRKAIKLYETLGFSEVGTRKNYYPDVNDKREDALIMAVELAQQNDSDESA